MTHEQSSQIISDITRLSELMASKEVRAEVYEIGMLRGHLSFLLTHPAYSDIVEKVLAEAINLHENIKNDQPKEAI